MSSFRAWQSPMTPWTLTLPSKCMHDPYCKNLFFRRGGPVRGQARWQVDGAKSMIWRFIMLRQVCKKYHTTTVKPQECEEGSMGMFVFSYFMRCWTFLQHQTTFQGWILVNHNTIQHAVFSTTRSMAWKRGSYCST